jgi:hypothetical protein
VAPDKAGRARMVAVPRTGGLAMQQGRPDAAGSDHPRQENEKELFEGVHGEPALPSRKTTGSRVECQKDECRAETQRSRFLDEAGAD